MGAFVAATTAADHPARVHGVVLVDGGLPLPIRQDVALEESIGPAVARLRMTFADRDEYRAFWKQHPAFARETWTNEIEAYVDHDLAGEPPILKSKVSPEAVSADGRDFLVGAADAASRATCPMHLLWADHGMLGEPGGLYDEERIEAHAPNVPATKVPGTNHYSIVFADHATDVVADTIAATAARAAAARR